MDPILLDLGFIELRYYGLFYAISIYLALKIITNDAKWSGLGLSEDEITSGGILIFLGSILGARIYYVMFNLELYFNDRVPWYEFLAIWHGGLAIHGGLIAGPLTMWLYTKRKNISFGKFADLVSPTLILGQAIGRLGNLMNGDAHGYPTDLPWGLVFPHGPASKEYPGQALHPVMLYESGLNLIAFFILFSLRKKGFKPGFITALYMLAYAFNRYVASNFRADDLYIMGMRAPFVMSGIGLVLGLALIFGLKLYKKAEVPQELPTENKPNSKKGSKGKKKQKA